MARPASTSRSKRARKAVRTQEYAGFQDVYRERWSWDKVAWGTHCVDCYPGGCLFRVYCRDGMVWREEQAGTFDTVEKGVPDNNPMGCQKGAAWSQQLYSPDRLLYPLKRVGERGSGKWKRISWDQALTEVADELIDAIREDGPESIMREGTPEIAAVSFSQRFLNLIGAVTTDLDGSINDFATGLYLTYGKFNGVSEIGDWFHSELVLIWHMNPAYTRIPHVHFINEARYNGAEVVSIAPDYNASAIHADGYLPVRPGTDAALALAMCQTIVAEGLVDERFVKEQTDLPLLVRTDTGRFLRASDLPAVAGAGPAGDADRAGAATGGAVAGGSSGGGASPAGDGGGGHADERFYFWDTKQGMLVEAGRATLTLGEADPALDGTFEVTLAGDGAANGGEGTKVEVTPVFALLREQVDAEYTPEQAAKVCSIHPESIRALARKVAARRTNIMMGYNSMKNYHGDLMERSMALLLALTGNWGKHGTGTRCWSVGQLDGLAISMFKRRPGLEGAQELLLSAYAAYEELLSSDATMTPEIASIEFEKQIVSDVSSDVPAGGWVGENIVPPAFFWYYHCGYRDIWNRREWGDPSMRRPFDDYFEEAVGEGWWGGLPDLAEQAKPRVLIECGGNMLRRTRGGRTMLLEHLWPKLKLIVTVDWRMSTTALHSDIVLPAANHYEKIGFHIPTPHLMNATFSDKAADPAGEAMSEWDIFRLLAEKVSERATQRGFTEYRDWQGAVHSLGELGETYTLGGALADEETLWDDVLRDTTLSGTLPQGTTLDVMRERGFVRFIGWGLAGMAQAQASDIRPNEVHVPFRRHVEQKQPYPTLARRAQFYIDHPWFIEANEALPRHKEPPKMGGDYPLHLTSGHPRHSIHAMNMTNPVLLETHRGHPTCFLSPEDAAARGFADDEEVSVFNDFGSCRIPVRISASVRPGQIIIYNGWEPFMHAGWKGANELEPGMVKWLHFASGYGHLRFWPTQWQPVPFDRGVYVEAEKVAPRPEAVAEGAAAEPTATGMLGDGAGPGPHRPAPAPAGTR